MSETSPFSLETSNAQSPLTPIIVELRRKHVVAAAATTGPNLSWNDSSDPWTSNGISSEDDAIGHEETDAWDGISNPTSCICTPMQIHRRSSRRKRSSNFVRQDSRNGHSARASSNVDLCEMCGKRRIFDPISKLMTGQQDQPIHTRARSKTLEHLGAAHLLRGASSIPEHAKALLNATPHLRHLSPASCDMNASGNLNSSRGLLSLFSNSSSPNPGNVEATTAPTINGGKVDYRTFLTRDKANHQAAAELSSFLWVLSHEMSLDNFGTVENEVFTAIFGFVHSSNASKRMAGVAALDSLIESPSADEEKKAIKFANNLSSSLRAPYGDYEFLSAVSRSLGHMAMRTTNVDFVESEITRALEWLRSDRSQRRLAASLTLKELAINASTAFFAKTTQTNVGHGGSNEFLDRIIPVLADPQPIVRACAADALSQCLKILVHRQHASLTALLCQIHFSLMDNLKPDMSKKKSSAAIAEAEQAIHGSLLAMACMIQYTRDFILPRFDEICEAVLNFTTYPKTLIRLEVIRLVPRLANRCPSVFGRRYLDKGLIFILKSASSPVPRVGVDLCPPAFAALGQLVLSMNDSKTDRLIGGSPSPTVKILNSNSTDPNVASVIIETSKTGIIYEKLNEIFSLVRKGLYNQSTQGSRGVSSDTHRSALYCAADLVQALGHMSEPFLPELVNCMFGSGLAEDLIDCLHSISASMPSYQAEIEDRLLQEISMCLAGTAAADQICDPLSFFGADFFADELVPRNIAYADQIQRSEGRPITLHVGTNQEKTSDRKRSFSGAESATERAMIRINLADDSKIICTIVLCLRTLGSFGERDGRVKIKGSFVPILPFVRDVVSHYLLHPSKEVRREAALTACALLIPYESPEALDSIGPTRQEEIYAMRKRMLGTHSGQVVEEVLTQLLQVAVSDPSPVVRLCVVQALDGRYDYFLCQAHHIQPLFFLLQDEALATRAAGLQLLGRLTRLNPAPILPVMRKVLADLIIELRCGSDTGRSREEATRLLVVFLRAEPLQRLVQPVLASLVEALPLKGVAPRLASAALEALGELARACRSSMKPWVKDIIPQIMETMQDQSSASKQRISLRTLGQIAGSTGYVVSPYLDYPRLLPQATDVLPSTKRAPWGLRREVIRTLGIVGALDPDQYHTVAPKTRKGGAVGGGYFLERDAILDGDIVPSKPEEESDALHGRSSDKNDTSPLPNTSSDLGDHIKDIDDDLPAHLYLYEQYAMVALPVSKAVPPQRMTPADEDFYSTVAIQALTRIFKDQSLAVHHGMVMQAIMFIFNFLGEKCVPFLSKVVPHMLHTIKVCSSSKLRQSLLKQVASLSGIVREHLRPYVPEIFEIVDELWESHLGTILALVTKIAAGIPDDFQKYLPRLVHKLLASIEDVQTSDLFTTLGRHETSPVRIEFEKLELLLSSVRSLRGVLGDYLHLLVPGLLNLADSLISASLDNDTFTEKQSRFNQSSIHTLQTLSHLLEYDNNRSPIQVAIMSWGDLNTDSLPTGCSLPARATQPLLRLLGNNPPPTKVVGDAIIESICVCARQLGRSRWIPLYNTVARNAIVAWEAQINQSDTQNGTKKTVGLALYDEVIEEMEAANLRRTQSLAKFGNVRRDSFLNSSYSRSSDPFGDALPVGSTIESNLDKSQQDLQNNPSIQPVLNQTSRHQVNQTALSLAWDVSQKASRDDWTEWMRRFAIQLLREAPSPALRATASLAHAYQPLARELFSAAFVCCWEELTEQYQRDLVKALEAAFVADVSPEILQTLLNLAEFMEHDGVGTGLPIHISNLAELALKCRSYAKALHYKEREYNQGGNGTGSCVEDLINMNKKLDLPEAALGVLKTSQLRMDPRLNEGVYPSGYGAFSDQLSSHFLRNDFSEELRYSVIACTDPPQVPQNTGVGISEVRESWLSKLGRWSEALQIYEEKLIQNPQDFDAVLGSMRCLDACGEWQKVLDLAEQSWPTLYAAFSSSNPELFIAPKGQKKFFKFAAQAAWRLDDWDGLEKYASAIVHGKFGSSQHSSDQPSNTGDATQIVDFDGAFFMSVLHIHRRQWSQAAKAIDAARQAMDGRFTALMAESYKRAYSGMISAQILAEMEEIIAYRKLESRAIASAHRHPTNRPNTQEARARLLSVWRSRLAGCRVDAEVHSKIIGVRSLILGPTDEVQATLMLSDLSRQAHMFKLAERVLLDPLSKLNANLSGPVFGFGLPDGLKLGLAILESNDTAPSMAIDRLITSRTEEFLPMYGDHHHQCSRQIVQEAGDLERLQIQHKLYFAFVKHLWSMDKQEEALHRLERLCDVVDLVAHCENQQIGSLSVACWLELADYKLEIAASPSSALPQSLQVSVLFALKRAILSATCGYQAWHAWALLNFRLAEQHNEQDEGSTARQRNQSSSNTMANHVVSAAEGFANAISLGTKRWTASVQQDMLNLLTCLFKYGDLPDVAGTINAGMRKIRVESWLGVLPQLLARIHIRKPSVRSVLHPLLTRLGERHPQALMYPLSVLLKSPVAERKSAAESLMNSLQAHSSSLVQEALMVSTELIRVAILWLETWHEGLEDASRLYFGEGNVSGMLDLLLPLHEKLEEGAETQKENEFVKNFGRDLAEAHAYVKEYVRIVTSGGNGIPTQGGSDPTVAQYDQSGNLVRQSEEAESAMNKAWDIYYSVFRWINKQLPGLTKLELNQCSPALSKAHSLELCVPGSYRVDGSYVKIEQFIPSVQVITSKQRPRKIILRGNDGRDYVFLLKGHEDLRQDERVMQLFGLVNALLARDRETKKHDLNIQRYTISPLSHNCGVVGWVPHCETLHSMIRDYRQMKKIPLNMENREMLKIAPDYDLLSVMEKVEVFTDALKRVTGRGNDLYEILWLKSTNSEEWLDRRTRFTRSLAVMSMVGYILGLGDRHPSNLMLDQLSGRVLHIDFGDCFEVAMNREKYPEKIPFRLTRMLVKAMEVSGIEGSYRSTCERTMSVLRRNRDSLVATLEAFVYDPLISWRLVGLSEGENTNHRPSPTTEGANEVLPSSGISHSKETTPIVNDTNEGADDGAPIDISRSLFHESIAEATNEDEATEEDAVNRRASFLTGAASLSQRIHAGNVNEAMSARNEGAQSAAKSRSLQMYSNIQTMAANLSTSSRIASIAGEGTERTAVEGSLAKSRIARSLRQREVMSLLEGQEGTAHEEALNEKALKVIRRVQDKLNGTDLDESDEALDVPDQVQRLIVQATSSENLCQLFIGWCAFW